MATPTSNQARSNEEGKRLYKTGHQSYLHHSFSCRLPPRFLVANSCLHSSFMASLSLHPAPSLSPPAGLLPLSHRPSSLICSRRPRTPSVVVRSSACCCSSSLYSVLGVERDVTLTTIKSAYRHLARLCHPDTCPDSDAQKCTEMFLRVQEAYETLSDPERRADYDYALLHSSSRGFPSNLKWPPARRTRATDRSDTSATWKLQWEEQLNRLKLRQRAATWSAKVRNRNLHGAPLC